MKIMSSEIIQLAVFAAPLIFPWNVFGESQITLDLDRKSGVYRKGDMVYLTVCYQKDGKPASGALRIDSYYPDGSSEQKIFSISGRNVFPVKLEKDAARFVVSEQRADKSASGKHLASAAIGVVADPQSITPGITEPSDFQQFWDRAKAELAKVPAKAVRKELEVTDALLPSATSWFTYVTRKEIDTPIALKGNFRLWDVRVDCVGNVPVSGYLTMPAGAKPKSLPVIVTFHGAGVRSASKAFVSGAIRFDVNAHGIENGREPAYYQGLASSRLKDYRRKNADSRDRFYFRNMFLRVIQALEYVKTLPEYDGETLIVIGNSQGGAQALAAGFFDPSVKLIYAGVPALCDHGGIFAGRNSGWPQLIRLKNGKPENPDILRTAAYYDMAFFAGRIRAEIYMTVGLVDTVCAPTTVFAAFNRIPPGRKHIRISPSDKHGDIDFPAFNRRVQEVVRAVSAKKALGK